jgi:hypothetical protein
MEKGDETNKDLEPWSKREEREERRGVVNTEQERIEKESDKHEKGEEWERG